MAGLTQPKEMMGSEEGEWREKTKTTHNNKHNKTNMYRWL